jgi:hypothetical protein
MEPVARLIIMHPHKRFRINIGVHSFNVGERVVVDVVFYFPEIGNTSEHIQ